MVSFMDRGKYLMKSLSIFKGVLIIQILVRLGHLGFGIKEILRMIISMGMGQFY